jgi:hypothetical protein
MRECEGMRVRGTGLIMVEMGGGDGNPTPTTLMSSTILHCVNTAVTRAVWLLQ